MNIEKLVKESFCVIGKEGSTLEGEGFVQRLWDDANGHFAEVQPLAKKDSSGNPVGVWGVMSDFSRSFKPWEDGFSKGLYLAGVECGEDVQPPTGWIKWQIPGYEYLRVRVENSNTFFEVLDYMAANGISLVGAVHDFTDPATGKNDMLFPIRCLERSRQV